MNSYITCPKVLSIAGSDCSGGAGIQADIKTISSLGAYAMSVITAITVQNTIEVQSAYSVSSEVVYDQIRAVMDDIFPDAIKIGMIGNAHGVRAIASAIGGDSCRPPIIYDPVMSSTSGYKVMDNEALEAIKHELFPLCALITPNLHEAEVLTGKPFSTLEQMNANLRALRQWGNYAVLLKGGHLEGNEKVDLLLMPDADEPIVYSSPHIYSQNTHGTGCTLSSAIAALCACNLPLPEAVGKAKMYVSEAIRQGADICIGKGHGPLNHNHSPLPLQKCLQKLAEIQRIDDENSPLG